VDFEKAVARGYGIVLEMLLERNPNRIYDFDAAILSASKNGHDKVVALALDKDANVNAQDENKNTPLILAAQYAPKNVVSLLLDSDADVHAVGSNGRTALLAVLEGSKDKTESLDIVRLLIDNRADVNAADIEGLTALHRAAFAGHDGAVQLLLSCGADIHVTSNSRTPLHSAATSGSKEVMTLLLKTLNGDPAINAQDLDGNTALLAAAEASDTTMVKLLVDAGADVDARNNHDYTALDWAKFYHNEPMKALLI
jgi:ankyrin repeat protein